MNTEPCRSNRLTVGEAGGDPLHAGCLEAAHGAVVLFVGALLRTLEGVCLPLEVSEDHMNHLRAQLQ